MRRYCALITALLVLVTLLVPLGAEAVVGTSFGGRILTWEPCLTPTGPGFFITIKPAGKFNFAYIWAPGTIGLPPAHIGQRILGRADIPYACTSAVGPRAGQRIQYDGVSI